MRLSSVVNYQALRCSGLMMDFVSKEESSEWGQEPLWFCTRGRYGNTDSELGMKKQETEEAEEALPVSPHLQIF